MRKGYFQAWTGSFHLIRGVSGGLAVLKDPKNGRTAARHKGAGSPERDQFFFQIVYFREEPEGKTAFLQIN